MQVLVRLLRGLRNCTTDGKPWILQCSFLIYWPDILSCHDRADLEASLEITLHQSKDFLGAVHLYTCRVFTQCRFQTTCGALHVHLCTS